MMAKRLFVLVAALLTFFCSTALAFEYPTYLNGDRNFIICGAHMGVACYVKKSSVVVQNYAPPDYEIYVETIMANFNDSQGWPVSPNVYKLSKLIPSVYRYNTNSMRMTVYNKKENNWRYIKPAGSMADTGHWYPGEMAYYIAFGQRFYGSRQWRHPYDGRMTNANCASDRFYSNVDNSW